MRTLVLLLPFAGPAAVALPHDTPNPLAPAPDPVGQWNEAALAAIKVDRTAPPVAARNLAMVHVAVYDAIALAEGEYDAFHATARPRAGASPVAAAAVAAHRVLADLYPCHLSALDDTLDATLALVPAGPGKDRGVTLGQAVAEQVLEWRAGDAKAAARHTYRPRDEAGRWRPTPPAHAEPLLPGWGGVPCFALTDPAAFRPPGPPKLDTASYAVAFREVRALGSAASAARTKDQTEVARFWADGEGTVTPPGHWNRIARTAAAGQGSSSAEVARLLALLNVAMADAAFVCWDCKYRFDVWRPVTAVREVEPDWSPLLPTPPFPAYTSGHSSFSGAAAAALAAFFGTDRVRFRSTADGLAGVTREYDTFAAAAEEAGMSRIYGGIHWAFDNADGLACGRAVGEEIARKHFRPPGARGRGEAPGVLPVYRRER